MSFTTNPFDTPVNTTLDGIHIEADHPSNTGIIVNADGTVITREDYALLSREEQLNLISYVNEVYNSDNQADRLPIPQDEEPNKDDPQENSKLGDKQVTKSSDLLGSLAAKAYQTA